MAHIQHKMSYDPYKDYILNSPPAMCAFISCLAAVPNQFIAVTFMASIDKIKTF